MFIPEIIVLAAISALFIALTNSLFIWCISAGYASKASRRTPGKTRH